MQSDQHIDNFLSKHMMTGSKISYHGLVKGLTIHSSGFEGLDVWVILFMFLFSKYQTDHPEIFASTVKRSKYITEFI